jgi:tetratricopeptide (TPR) repeat protein
MIFRNFRAASRMRQKFIYAYMIWLLFTAGVFSDGLPGEFIISQRWRDLLYESSPVSNPAYMLNNDRITVHGAFSSTVNNAFKLWEIGGTVPLTLHQAVGLSWLGEGDGSIENASADPQTGELVSSGNTISNQTHFGAISYSINPWNRLNIGTNLTVLRTGNFNNPVTGYGLDIGAVYGLPHHKVIGDNEFGLMLQNIISPKVDAAGDEYASRTAKISWTDKLWDDRIESGLDLNIRDLLPSGSDFTGNGDKSWFEKPETRINYRLGAWLFQKIKLYALAGTNYWGLAFGAAIPSSESGGGWSFMYQYMSLDNNDDAVSNTFYLTKDFGKIGRIASRSKALKLDPNDLYNKAMRLYKSGQYWDAYFVFSKIYAVHHDFFKNDWVSYYRGKCLEELDMRNLAETVYRKTRNEYPKSRAVAHADLGLMRIYYRNGDFRNVSKQFDNLDRSDVPDSLKFHAYYYMGCGLMQNNENSRASRLLGSVPSSHPENIFARHSRAITAIRLGDKVGAYMALENCLDESPSSDAEKQIIERSLLLTGYMYYEDNALPMAVKALRAVPSSSYYYTDALLGLGWSAVKARNIDNCINVGNKLSSISRVPVTRLEGMLIEAYGHFTAKDYKKASDVLGIASDILDTLSSGDSLSEMRKKCGMDRAAYDIFSKDVENISTDTAGGDIDGKNLNAMHRNQIAFQKNISSDMKAIDEMSRTAFFGKGIEDIRTDINYLFATVKSIMARSGQIELHDKAQKENEKIDEQIKKLKDELDSQNKH